PWNLIRAYGCSVAAVVGLEAVHQRARGALGVSHIHMHDLAARKPSCVEGDGGPREPTVGAWLNKRRVGQYGEGDCQRSATLLAHKDQRLLPIHAKRYDKARGILERAVAIRVHNSERLTVCTV